MKRPRSCDSIEGTVRGGSIPICPKDDEGVFRRVGSLHSILDGYGEEDEDEMMMMGEDAAGGGGRLSLSYVEKKRRLSVEQVKALEKDFVVENKLEPERKVKLALELGLQPRQVAVWFQNRRARWKTKQLERDYGVLKASYDALKLNYDGLVQDKEALLAEIKELKTKLVDGEGSYGLIKTEPVVKEEEELEATNNKKKMEKAINGEEDEDDDGIPPLLYKDGSSESDSSAILNDLSYPFGILSNQCGFHENELLFVGGFNSISSSTSSTFHHYPDGRSTRLSCNYYQPPQKNQQQMLLKSEDSHEYLSGEEPCSMSFFSDEQPPELVWW